MKKFRSKLIAGAAIAVMLVAGGGATAAFAATEFSGGAQSCANRVLIGSNARGTVSHYTNYGISPDATWNNGSTYQSRISYAGASISQWRAKATGIGADIASAYPKCS